MEGSEELTYEKVPEVVGLESPSEGQDLEEEVLGNRRGRHADGRRAAPH